MTKILKSKFSSEISEVTAEQVELVMIMSSTYTRANKETEVRRIKNKEVSMVELMKPRGNR